MASALQTKHRHPWQQDSRPATHLEPKGSPVNLRKHLTTAAAATALLAGTALPASADDTGDTTTTFTLAGGDLAITIPLMATLNEGDSGDLLVTGTLGEVLVTDDRGAILAWAVSAESTAFTGSEGSSSTGISYTAGPVE